MIEHIEYEMKQRYMIARIYDFTPERNLVDVVDIANMTRIAAGSQGLNPKQAALLQPYIPHVMMGGAGGVGLTTTLRWIDPLTPGGEAPTTNRRGIFILNTGLDLYDEGPRGRGRGLPGYKAPAYSSGWAKLVVTADSQTANAEGQIFVQIAWDGWPEGKGFCSPRGQ